MDLIGKLLSSDSATKKTKLFPKAQYNDHLEAIVATTGSDKADLEEHLDDLESERLDKYKIASLLYIAATFDEKYKTRIQLFETYNKSIHKLRGEIHTFESKHELILQPTSSNNILSDALTALENRIQPTLDHFHTAKSAIRKGTQYDEHIKKRAIHTLYRGLLDHYENNTTKRPREAAKAAYDELISISKIRATLNPFSGQNAPKVRVAKTFPELLPLSLSYDL